MLDKIDFVLSNIVILTFFFFNVILCVLSLLDPDPALTVVHLQIPLGSREHRL